MVYAYSGVVQLHPPGSVAKVSIEFVGCTSPLNARAFNSVEVTNCNFRDSVSTIQNGGSIRVEAGDILTVNNVTFSNTAGNLLLHRNVAEPWFHGQE